MGLHSNIALSLLLLLLLRLATAPWIEARMDAGLPQADAQRTPARPEANHASRVAWTVGNVEKSLLQAGILVRRGTRITQPFMRVPATVLIVEAAHEMEIQVYVYRSAAARLRDTSRLDPQRVAPPGVSPTWLMPPSLVLNGNLALIILTRNEELRKSVTAAFGHK